MALPPDFAAGIFYSDLKSEQTNRWTALLKPQSAGHMYFLVCTIIEDNRF